MAAKTKLWLHTVHKIIHTLHILCARAQVIGSALHTAIKSLFFFLHQDIINQKPLYADMNGAEKKWSDENKLFHIIFFLRASLLQMHEWSARAHCKLLHATRIRVWNCFSIRRIHIFVNRRRTFWSHCFPLNLRWSNGKSSTPWLPVSLLCSALLLLLLSLLPSPIPLSS